MANHKNHKGVGIVAGVAAAAWTIPPEAQGLLAIMELLGGGVGGAGGASLPDILEPATSSHHRKFFHGMVPAGVAIKRGTGMVLETQQRLRARAVTLMEAVAMETDLGRRWGLWFEAILCATLAGAVVGAAAGYASHLALDAMTPRGLPLV